MELLENLNQYLRSLKSKMKALLHSFIYLSTLSVFVTVKTSEEGFEIISYNTTSPNSDELNENEVNTLSKR